MSVSLVQMGLGHVTAQRPLAQSLNLGIRAALPDGLLAVTVLFPGLTPLLAALQLHPGSCPFSWWLCL